MMSDAAEKIVRRQLIRDEGTRLHPYTDTAGKVTIGTGRNLTDVGISLNEADVLLGHDIDRAGVECGALFKNFGALDPIRQATLLSMAFNLGGAGLSGFTTLRRCVESCDWTGAADAMGQSRWATQVGARADRLCQQMRTGSEV